MYMCVVGLSLAYLCLTHTNPPPPPPPPRMCMCTQVDVAADKVALYVGAKTFIEYSIEECLVQLQEQIAASHLKLQELNEDLVFLRTSSITVEVNMARLFNYSVKLKKAKAAGK